jgi:BlaI family transcriptional regulator, penicillinase repressor
VQAAQADLRRCCGVAANDADCGSDRVIPGCGRAGAGNALHGWAAESAQADFVSLLRGIHSLFSPAPPVPGARREQDACAFFYTCIICLSDTGGALFSMPAMSYSLTELQLALMKVMWDGGEVTVVDLHEALRAERKIAQSTVATLLARMEKKGLVTHRQEGRQYLYRALVSEGQVRRSVVAEVSGLFGRLFEGDVTEMVSHLLRESDVEADDLARLKRMIQEREAELNGGEA